MMKTQIGLGIDDACRLMFGPGGRDVCFCLCVPPNGNREIWLVANSYSR